LFLFLVLLHSASPDGGENINSSARDVSNKLTEDLCEW
jgi:hypothetical protein